MTKAFFLTGTDTEVGKTYSACALLEAAAARGKSTLGLKPVSAGCEYRDDEWQNDDALQLQKHSTIALPYQQVNPVALQEPASPHIAAALENKTVSASRLVGFIRGALMSRPDFALVEGAGGWRVPISARETMADLARQLELPVIVVVAMRLGCLNHALLTVEAIRRDGLQVAGWVANQVSKDPMSHHDENVATLKSSLNCPFLGSLPYMNDADPSRAQAHLVIDCLDL